jgi:plastocyanin domain-containing protein
MMKASAMLVVVLGIIMLGRGFALSGISVPSIDTTSAANVSTTSEVIDGAQNITSDQTSRGYPSITVQKDIPVVWNLKADSGVLNGCNGTLVISDFDIKVKLKTGDNIIKFTPTKSGTLTYFCWMGMVTGKIKVVDSLNGQSAQTASDESTDLYAAGAQPQGSCCAGGAAN